MEIELKDFKFPVPVTVTSDGCWIPEIVAGLSWPSNGYFVVMFDGEPWSGHRLSRFLNFGDAERLSGSRKENLVCHHCDNKSCANPNHSYVGTQGQNVKDWFERNEQGRINHSNSLMGNKNAVGSKSWSGKNHSDESKQLMSVAKLGIPKPEGWAESHSSKLKETWDRRRKMGSMKKSSAKYQNAMHTTVILGSEPSNYQSAVCFLGEKHKAIIKGVANHG